MSNRGIQAVTADEFSALDAMGGVRGLAESVLPGLLFIVVFQITRSLLWALVVSGAAALIMVAIRLVQHTRVSQAAGGVLGIAIGAFWAWRTGSAADFFAFGLWQNAAYLLVVLIGQLLWWPAVGVVIELLRVGLHSDAVRQPPKVPIEPGDVDQDDRELLASDVALVTGENPDPTALQVEDEPNPFAGFGDWRDNKPLLRRYWLASWFWVAMFALRLAVQLPLYFGGSVGWLGTARLLMGVPLWALVLYATWVLTHGAHHKPARL